MIRMIVALLFSILVLPATRAAEPAYRLARTIPLGGEIKWDYLYFDPANNRLYISHGNELTVVDPRAGKVVGHVTGLAGSHGIAIDPQTGLGYADSAKTQSVSVFDISDLRVVKTLPALADADGMAFDPQTGQVFIAGGDADAVLAIDARGQRPRTLIPLGGSPEFLVTGDHALFININDKNQLVKIDPATDAVTARWPLPGCTGPTGLAIDPRSQRLFVSCRNDVLAVFDAQSGARVALLPIGKGSDSVRFDPASATVFSANADGTLSIIAERSPSRFVALPPLTTAPGARTMEIDPRSGALFLVTAHVISSGPPTKPGRAPYYQFEPGTLELLTYLP